jgi:large subunit ribosomal protein L10
MPKIMKKGGMKLVRKAIEKKIFEVETLTEKMKAVPSLIVVDYLGLTVEAVTTLRRQLYDAKCDFKVIKNNIIRRAAIAAGLDDLADGLVGPSAVAFSNEDPVAAAKILYEFAKTHDALKLKKGTVDSQVLNLEQVQQLAQTPSRETLLTMFAAGLLQPIKEVAIGLNMHIENLEKQ